MRDTNYTLVLSRQDGSDAISGSSYCFTQYNSKTTTNFKFWWTTNNRQSEISWYACGY